MNSMKKTDTEFGRENKIPITVLMSTYNGEMYLREQLDSLICQKDVIVHLVVRDDGSTDGTHEILNEYLQIIKESNTDMTMKVIFGKNKGAMNSFMDLIFSDYDTEWIALADQDDVWDENKLVAAIKYINENVEEINGPILYTSNLRLVDSELKFIRNNRETAPNINKYTSFFELWCTGCTMVYNQKLAELICHYRPINVNMHDTWVGFIAYQMGEVVYDITPHISYRQHSNNVMGVNLVENPVKKFLFQIKKNGSKLFSSTRITIESRTNEYLCNYRDILNKEQIERALIIIDYKKSFINRWRFIMDNRFKISPITHDLYFKLCILIGKL